MSLKYKWHIMHTFCDVRKFAKTQNLSREPWLLTQEDQCFVSKCTSILYFLWIYFWIYLNIFLLLDIYLNVFVWVACQPPPLICWQSSEKTLAASSKYILTNHFPKLSAFSIIIILTITITTNTLITMSSNMAVDDVMWWRPFLICWHGREEVWEDSCWHRGSLNISFHNINQ